MKYATFKNGTPEIREDNSAELPSGALLLTDEQYAGLIDGILKFVNGQVVQNV